MFKFNNLFEFFFEIIHVKSVIYHKFQESIKLMNQIDFSHKVYTLRRRNYLL